MALNNRKVVTALVVAILVTVWWYSHSEQLRSSSPLRMPLSFIDGIPGFEHIGSTDTNGRKPFYPGTAKPPGSNYSRVLVVPKIEREQVDWIAKELPGVEAAIYEVDNPSAEYRVPKNKGNEAMVYLTYIIDHYDKLPDTIIFIHAHETAWHNNFLLDLQTPLAIRRLRDDRVARQGYMNLRCHHDPGCPDHIHLDRAEVDYDPVLKPEERVFSFELFQTLFPGHRPPPVLSQACCAQFAVSRERVRDNPKSLYEHLRNWLLAVELVDNYSGRVFEYLWQYLFTRNAEHCPAMNACYCDGYGICFGGAGKLDAYLKKVKDQELANEEFFGLLKANNETEKERLKEVEARIAKLNHELSVEKEEAYLRGEDEANRALERERVQVFS
jgi:hypothetical protein